MSVTVSSRPSTWSAVKNPVVYKFATTGGPFTNYRIEVEVFRASDNSSLTGGVKFAFSPDSDDVTYADISTIIKAYLKAEWIKPAAINETETDTFLKYYIKYQELYDGSATSIVDDVANLRYAVFGGLQIPSTNGNNLTDYVPASSTKKFLTLFETPKLWRSYPATLSFIYPNGLVLRIARAQDNLAPQQQLLDTGEDDAVNRINLFAGVFSLSSATRRLIVSLTAEENILDDASFDAGIGGGEWTSVESSDTPNNAWVNGAAGEVETALSNPSNVLYTEHLTQVLDAEYPAGDYTLKVNASAAYFAGPAPIITVIRLVNNGVEQFPVYESSSNEYPESPGDLTFGFTAAEAFDEIRIQLKRVAVEDSVTITFYSAELIQYVDYTEELTFEVENACQNPVMLFWKNSLGGDAFWLFEADQEVSYNLTGMRKAKRMMLYANNLTEDQWTALNELNHLGEVYRNNITEFTSSVNKSHLRDGSQVYVVDADGNKTGVIVIPTQNTMFTRMQRHQFRIEIEFPERYE